jgi:hypothetical protein
MVLRIGDVSAGEGVMSSLFLCRDHAWVEDGAPFAATLE